MAITPMRLILINLLVLALFSFLRATLLPAPEAHPELPAPGSHGPALRAGLLVERAAERVAATVALASREVRQEATRSPAAPKAAVAFLGSAEDEVVGEPIENSVVGEPIEDVDADEPVEDVAALAAPAAEDVAPAAAPEVAAAAAAPVSDGALAEVLEAEDSLVDIAAMEGVPTDASLVAEGELPEEDEAPGVPVVAPPASRALLPAAHTLPEVAVEAEELTASPLELAEEPAAIALAVMLEPSHEVEAEDEEVEPESREDAAAAAVEVARAVAVADSGTPETADEAGPAEEGDEEVADAGEVQTTLARYTEGVREVRRHLHAKAWGEAVGVADRLLELEDLIGEQRAWLLYLKARAERARGNVLTAVGLYGEAIDHDPPGAHYKNSLAWLMCTSKHPRIRDLEAAVKLAEEAVRDGGAKAQYLDTLARAYFEADRFEDAVLTQRRAVESDPDRVAFQDRLDWYRDEAIKIASR